MFVFTLSTALQALAAQPTMTSPNEIASFRVQLIASLRKKGIRDSSYLTTVEAMKFLRSIVVHGKYENSSELLALLDDQSVPIFSAAPFEFCIRNAFGLVQKLIRDESLKIHGGDEASSQYDSLTKLWNRSEQAGAATAKKLKRGLIGAINEVVTEMENCRDNIGTQAAELIQSHDCIICLSVKSSATLNAFLTSAQKKKHRVLAVFDFDDFDSSPENVTPIRLVDVATKIVEATKVVIPGVAVFPDGSCFVPAGGLQTAIVAQRHTLPVYVLAAFYKITPMFVPDPQLLNPRLPPKIPFAQSRHITGDVHIVNPAFDLLPAHLVSLYVTNSAAIVPAHVYRLIGDYYHPEDIALSNE